MRNLLVITTLLMLSACSTNGTTNTAAATFETASQAAMSGAIGYMSLPRCSETVTSLCGTADIAKKINDSQLALEATLKAYRAALVAYKASQTESNASAVALALTALSTATTSLNAILSLDSVKEALGN